MLKTFFSHFYKENAIFVRIVMYATRKKYFISFLLYFYIIIYLCMTSPPESSSDLELNN
jgi:phage shock protein PspC (stress-responsive transcriptional regulator)